MFTGLVVARGRLSADPSPSPAGGVALRIEHPAQVGERLAVGASLAVCGVCLTVTETSREASTVELSPETLARTRLGALRQGDRVNLEPALRLGDPLGGHWVQGHVDGLTRIVGRRDLHEHRELAFALAPEHRPLVVEKGSVTVDGVSLTIARLDGPPGEETAFWVALIPHTLAVTTLGERGVGDEVHLELDVLGKYVARAAAPALVARGLGGAA